MMMMMVVVVVVVDCSRLAPRVAASCQLLYLACVPVLCCPAWQLVDCVQVRLSFQNDLFVIKGHWPLTHH